MKIVGKLIGKQKIIYEEDIYQCMIDLNELNKKITWNKIAELLNCSSRTIYRNISKELRTEKIILNEEI
jgi:AraC-like DNA-binding protein